MVESLSKTPVDRSAAAAIVDDAFGPDVALVELDECTEGWFNAVYRMTLSDGRRFVLKVAPPPEVPVLTYEHDIMATEVHGLRLIGGRTAVPVPAVLWWDTTCRRLPSSLFLMEQCPGQLLSDLRPNMAPDDQQIVDAQIAGLLRQMNSITNSTFGRQAPSAPTFRRWSDAFTQLFDDALDDAAAASVALPVRSEVLRALLRENAALLDEVNVPSFVHWDLWDPNIFVDPHTHAVVGVIDFERALWADPLMEGQFLSKGGDQAFLDSYGVSILDTAGAQRRRLLYDLYLGVVMVVEVAYRHYPTDDIDTSGRFLLAVTLDALGIAAST